MYHWRILPRSRIEQPTAEELKALESDVELWEGSLSVRKRLEENLKASADIVLFLEQIPENLHKWLRKQIAKGGDVADTACAMVESNLKKLLLL